MNSMTKKITGWKQRIFREMIEYWINVIYLAVFFSVFTNYRRLILAHYQISYENYGISIIKALVLAKVIMAGRVLCFGRGFKDKPLVIPTLYKTVLFTVWVAIFDVIESMIRSFIHGKDLMGAFDDLINRFTYEWFAGTMVIFFAFIPFFAAKELGRVLGEGKIHKLFFQRSKVAESDLTNLELH